MFTLNSDRVTTVLSRLAAAPFPAEATKKAAVVFAGKADEEFDNKRSSAFLRYVFASPTVVSNVLCGMSVEENKVLVLHGKDVGISLPANHTMNVTVACYDEDKDAAKAHLDSFLGEGTSASLGPNERQDIADSSEFGQEMNSLLDNRIVPGTAVFTHLLASKCPEECRNIEKAGALCRSIVQKFMLPQLLGFVESTEFPTQKKFSDDAAACLANPQTLPGLDKMDPRGFSAGLVPVMVRSGGNDEDYELGAVQPEPAGKALSADCTVFGVSARFEGYCAYIARTYFFPPRCGEYAIGQYDYVSKVQAKVVELLTVGVKLCDAYTQAMAFAKEENSELASLLEPSFGFSTGLVMMETNHSISPKGDLVVEPGMTLVVRVVLKAPRAGDSPSVGIALADTYVVDPSDGLLRWATKMKKESDEVVFREEEPEDEDEEPVEVMHHTTRARAGEDDGVVAALERKGMQHKILQEKRAQWEASGGRVGVQKDEEDITAFEIGRLAKGNLPEVGVRPALSVSPDRQIIWLPVGSDVVPFHISTIQKAEVKTFGQTSVLTVTFFSTQEANVAFRAHRSQVFIKELTIQHSDRPQLEEAAQKVRDIAAAIKTKDTQRKASHGVVKQGGLVLNKSGNAPRLKRVRCRPAPFAGKGQAEGDLEAHDNGFRYNYVGGEAVIVLYDNVKYAVFQPADGEAFTVFHLALKQPILLNKKKVDQVQFVAEVINQSEFARVQKRGHEEEMEADEREEKRIKETNAQFVAFCRGLEKVSGFDQRVQVGYRGLSFEANCGRSGQITFRGNNEALWSLTDFPFWFVMLNEAEVVSLERVFPGSQTFDLRFIGKDYRKVTELSSVPMEKLDKVKDYLNSSSMIYFESATPIAWNNVLKEIRDDKEWEPWGESGWCVYMDEDGGDEDEESDSDDDYDDSSDDGDSDDSDEDSSFASSDAELVSEDTSLSTESTGSGLSWDAMDRKAEEDDRRRGRDSEDSDSDAPRRKRQRGGAAPARGAPKKAPPAKGMAPAKGMPPKVAYGAKRPPVGGPGMKFPPGMPPRRP